MACAPLVGTHLYREEEMDWSYKVTVPTNLVVGVMFLLISLLIWWCYFRLYWGSSRPGWLRYLGFMSLVGAGVFIVDAFTIG